METTPKSELQEVIEWWKEFGFKREDWDRSDVVPLFYELLEKIVDFPDEDQEWVLEWIEENG